MCDFAPGDVVVCVDARPDRVDAMAHLLAEGRVYRVGAAGNRSPDGVYALAFHDLPSNTPGRGWAFSARRFRKLNDGKDDAELIERIKSCRPIREKQDA